MSTRTHSPLPTQIDTAPANLCYSNLSHSGEYSHLNHCSHNGILPHLSSQTIISLEVNNYNYTHPNLPLTGGIVVHCLVSALSLGPAAPATTAGGRTLVPTLQQGPAGLLDNLLPGGAVDTLEHPAYTQSEHGYVLGHAAAYTPELQSELEAALIKIDGVFAKSLIQLTGYTGTYPPFEIPLTSEDEPCFQKPRRLSHLEEKIMREKLTPLLEAGIVVPSNSTQYACNSLLAAKKDASGAYTDYRYVTDFRKLNERSKAIPYRLPLIDALFQGVGASTLYSKVDTRQAFLQLHVKESDKDKLSFWGFDRTLLRYERMPFGTKGAPAWYQSVVDHEIRLAGLSYCCCTYLDDLLIHTSKGPAIHTQDIIKCLEMLQRCNILAHAEKCVFGCDILSYLGHTISPLGTTPHMAKVAAIQKLPVPTDLHTLRMVLGFMNYYRSFVVGFAAIARPLTLLTGKGVPFMWGTEQQTAFDTLKKELCDNGKALRRADPEKQYTIHCDFSHYGIAGVLSQIDDTSGQDYMIATVSRSLSKSEKNYSSWQGECLAAVYSVRSFRHFVMGTHFILCSDHAPLQYLMQSQNLTGMHCRWALCLAEYDFTVVHRPGVKHANADVCSRFPLDTTEDRTGARFNEDPPEGTSGSQPPANHSTFDPVALLATLDAYTAAPELHSIIYKGLDLIESDIHPFWNQPPDTSSISLEAQHQILLRRTANKWVHAATPLPHPVPHFSDMEGLDTSTLPSSQVSCILQSGVTLFEPFGGICAGLEMLLRNGITVNRYIYADINPAAQAIAKHRLQELSHTFPYQLLPPAWKEAFSSLPQDVRQINESALINSGATDRTQWVIIAGSECQDLSPAGSNQGLSGHKSSTLFPLLSMVATLQRLQKSYIAPIYYLENTAMQHNFSSLKVRTQDFQQIYSYLGHPICVDATLLGSLAHRLRNYWTNLACTSQVMAVLGQVSRPLSLRVDSILDDGHTSQPVKHNDQLPYTLCNRVGHPRSALPTLMSFQSSHAFRDNGPGMILNIRTNQLREPTATERERAMGYSPGTTAAPGISEQQRCAALGNCMDSYAMQSIMAICMALNRVSPPISITAAVTHTRPFTFASKYGPGLHLMLQDGWEPGTGLGPTASGIVQPIQLPAQLTRRALGYRGNTHTAKSAKIPPSLKYRQPVLFQQAGLRVSSFMTGITEPQPIQSASSAYTPFTEDEVSQLGGVARALTVSLFQHGDPSSSSSTTTDAYTTGPYDYEHAIYLHALVTDATNPPISEEIWDDASVMQHLMHPSLPMEPSTTASDKRRITRRAAAYTFISGILYRCMHDGTKRQVPAPEKRTDIIKSTHDTCGHFGTRRTAHMLRTSYWWKGLDNNVRDCIHECAACARASRATFSKQAGALQPLPIEGMHYRWGVDLAKMPDSRHGNRYVMVAIEHISKWVDLIPMPSKEATSTSYAFLHNVIGRFGAMAECVTDQGREFLGEFQTLLARCLIDHRMTSANHPQSDGLSERLVQVVKRGLEKYVASGAYDKEDWDMALPWIALGYRCSIQASTGFSPYQMMFAVTPTLPPAVKERLSAPIDMEDQEAASASILTRAMLMKDMCVTAGNNLRIAQHRDTLRYARIRGGGYLPKLRKFEIGDFVYTQRFSKTKEEALDPRARREILRVKEVRPTGVLFLQGKCGSTIAVRAEHCAPCHLANIDGTLDFTLRSTPENLACQICQFPDQEASMLLCDGCESGYHMHCLTPQLTSIPIGKWACPQCVSRGVTALSLETNDTTQRRATAPATTAPQQISQKESAAASLNGRIVARQRRAPDGSTFMLLGKVQYLGTSHLPCAFKITYPDGSSEQLTQRQVNLYVQPIDTAPVPQTLNPQMQQPSPSTRQDPVSPGTSPRRSNRISSRHGTTNATALVACNTVNWPLELNYSSPNNIKWTMQILMPGSWTVGLCAELHHNIQQWHHAGATAGAPDPSTLGTSVQPGEVKPILAAIDFTHTFCMADPWTTTGMIAEAFQQARYHMITNSYVADGADFQLDALQPETYQRISQYNGINAIISSPWPPVADPALALAIDAATNVVCFHVPAHYVSNAHPARLAFLKQLQSDGRLMALVNLPRGPSGQRYMWLVVFRNAAIKQLMVRPEYRELSLSCILG